MNHMELENQANGLGDVFDILVRSSPERLLSLIIKLGESPEDAIIHALCLIIFLRETEALRKLQMLQDNPLANHLAEKLQSGGGKLDDFGAHCRLFEAKSGESLTSLARVLKILCEQRFCDQLLVNQAYKRAISSQCFKLTYLEYDHFTEEARAVCGPQVAEWISSSSDIKSESSLDPYRSLNEGNTTLNFAVPQGESANVHCLPSPLQESPSGESLPTHLEISLPSTVSFQGDKPAAALLGNLTLNPSVHLVSGNTSENVPGRVHSTEPKHKPAGTSLFGAEKSIKIDAASKRTQPNVSNTETKSNLHFILPNNAGSKSTHDRKEAEEEEEEEDEFYAFVILHAPQDSDMADSMKDKLETVIGTKGATFSDNFSIPGKSALGCVEDAVNNSAFTFLLLTRNFNSRMVEMKTNMALINSINNEHKFNTVIPLLPEKNCMPQQSIPITLQTLVPLDERRNFEKKLQRVFSKTKIEKQRKIWAEEQRKRRQLLLEKERLRRPMEQSLALGVSVPLDQERGDPRPWWPQQSNIHIENASCIMIGNDSTMTVTLEGSADNNGVS